MGNNKIEVTESELPVRDKLRSVNYDRLCQWVKAENLAEKADPIQALIGDHEGEKIINASTDISVSSSMENEGGISNIVCTRKLDNLTDENVSFIKMDIVGAEIDALKCASKIIRKNKPQMMISAYHRMSHIWEIPLLLKEIEPPYNIFCGHQMNVAFEPEIYVMT